MARRVRGSCPTSITRRSVVKLYIRREMVSLRLVILLVTASCQQASGDQLWWPFTWLKIGMQAQVLPKVHKSSAPLPSNGRPRNVDQFLGRQSQLRPRKRTSAIQAVSAMKSSMPRLLGTVGDSGQSEKSNRSAKTTVSGYSTTSGSTTSTVPATTSSPNGSVDCSQAAPTEVRTSSVAKSCAPGENCRIHLRSFETGDPLFQYAYSHSSALDPILQNIYDNTRSSGFAPPLTSDAMVPPEVVKLCMGLAKALRANRVLVIGVFTGLSVVGAALSVEYGGQVVGVEDPRYVKYWNSIGGKYAFEAGLARSIVIQASGLVDEYLEHLAKTQPNTFDLIILDDNDMENYEKDYEHALRLLRPKGVMIINDVFVEGSVLSGLRYRNKATETVAILNKRVRDDHRLESAVVIPFGGGIMMLVKK